LVPVNVNLEEQKGEERETSEKVQKRVKKARFLQYERYGEEICNGRVEYNVSSQKVLNFRVRCIF
jgi:magnesium chelatase family protein